MRLTKFLTRKIHYTQGPEASISLGGWRAGSWLCPNGICTTCYSQGTWIAWETGVVSCLSKVNFLEGLGLAHPPSFSPSGEEEAGGPPRLAWGRWGLCMAGAQFP